MTLTYDQLPYDGFPVPSSHPDALSAVARLFGLRPADVPGCRVLELGCGTGANLVPMAAAFPKASFVGVDLSPVQIDLGRAEARAVGLSNLELVAADLSTWAAPSAPFDFILAHGVFSWVPRDVQDALLALARRSLAPQGVAYVSYSALPGDHPRQALRETLSWSVRSVADPKERVRRARDFAAVLGRHLPDRAPGAPALRKFVAEVGAMSDSYVLHDLLAETHQAFTLSGFVQRAQAHGLSYLGDAQLHAMFAGDLDEEVVEALRASATDQASFEEGMDLFTQRPFRTSLLCRAEAPVRRDLTWERLEGLALTTQAQVRGEEDGHWLFRAPGGQVFGSPDPLVGAMLTQLVHARPAPVRFEELCDRARAQVGGAQAKATVEDREILGMNLLAALGAGQVTAGTCDRAIRTEYAGEQPPPALASARRQAEAGGWATNLWHQRVELDPDQRRLLPLLDGTRTRAALVEQTKENALWLEAHLASLAELAFLVCRVPEVPREVPMAGEKVAIVTGGNRGLGLATVEKLARRGFHVVLTARRDGEAAAAAVKAKVPDARVQSLPLDLASFESIRGFAQAFHALGLPLHLLVNNAGLMNEDPSPAKTADGFELTLGTNHIGHFLLTHLLLGDLERSAPARLVVLSSSLHRKGFGPGPGPDFDYDNLDAEKSFHPMVAYRNSKLANLWFTHELARRLKGRDVAVLAVNPGWVPATLAATRTSAWQRFLFRRVFPLFPFARTVDQATDNTVFAATDPALQAHSGGYYEDLKPGILSDDAKDEAKARRLWDASCGWCGIGSFGVVAQAKKEG